MADELDLCQKSGGKSGIAVSGWYRMITFSVFILAGIDELIRVGAGGAVFDIYL